MITVTGVQLYRWYQQGITELEDLQWLLWFNHKGEWPLVIVGAELQTARKYFEK